MTDVKQLIREAAFELGESDDPETQARELAQFAFSLSKNDILLQPLRDIDDDLLEKFHLLVRKRKSGYPLQYILGEWDFYGINFAVREGVLIPRPETEQIVYEANKFLSNKKNQIVFDLCSGTGCIGLSVAVNNPDCKVYLFDIAPEALACCRENVQRLSLTNVTVLDYDIFNGFADELEHPDVLLSNPPYVTKTEFLTLEREIFFEPENAIVADGDGLCFYRSICRKWLPELNDGGFYMLESGEGQPDYIKNMIDASDAFSCEIEKDMYGVNRFVRGIKL